MIKGIGLTKVFDSKTALDCINFEIQDGCIYGLIGSNGSGKSTLLRLISGVYAPDGGTITVDGEPIYNNAAVKAQTAFLGDTPYYLPQSNLKEMAAFYKSVYASFDESVYRRLLELFPIGETAKIATMSKGMQRQAALILAIATSPRYLLLDEAFDGLDVVMRKVLKGILIEGMESRNMTTIIASHNIRELEDLCDHVSLIHNGEMLFNDSTEHLKGKLHKVQLACTVPPHPSVFAELEVLKTEQTGLLTQMVVRGDKHHILEVCQTLDPLFVECLEPSLEEMFIYELEVNGYDAQSLTE
ncbi:MAG: ABC transporter ATP-binding protein [Clostridia bacterium]|nr:ABC transporter ATP-binding protein [Clostridia bacterium]